MTEITKIKECAIFSTLFYTILKHLLLAFLAYNFINIGVSQTYEIHYSTSIDDISEDAVELPDKSIIFSVSSGFYNQAYYQAKLYKLSPYGIFVDSVDINIPEGYLLKGLDNIFKISDTTYSVVGYCASITDDSIRIFITHFKEDLDILFSSLTEFSFPNSYNIGNNVLNVDNSFVTVGTDLTEYNHFLYQYDLYGYLINHKYYIDNNLSPRFANAIKEIDSIDRYHLYLSAFPQDFWIINKQTLEIETILDYPETLYPWDTHNGVKENTYLAIGRKNIPNSSNKLPCFAEMDIYGSIVNLNYYGSPDTNTGNIDKSLDIFNDKIFLGAAYNFLVTPSYPFVPQQQWLMLNRINSDYSLSWQYFYKGEVNYMPYKVLATSDGGALIISTRYDWNDSITFQRDVHILKVDSTGWYDGLTTGIAKIDQPKQILVYPNPAKDKVNFVFGLYQKLEINLFNLMGELILSEKYLSSPIIDISHFPTGTYIYTIKGSNGFFEKGKLVKQ